MSKSDYIPNDNFEVSVYITLTEFCHKKSSESKYGRSRDWANLREWGEYYRKQIVGNSNFGPISKELAKLYLEMNRMYALDVKETIEFVILYFNHRMWLDYEPLLNARKDYTGSYY